MVRIHSPRPFIPSAMDSKAVIACAESHVRNADPVVTGRQTTKPRFAGCVGQPRERLVHCRGSYLHRYASQRLSFKFNDRRKITADFHAAIQARNKRAGLRR